ncbi:MAG: hypothetical protein Fues2KO_38820 [Fuerstiella sp.]
MNDNLENTPPVSDQQMDLLLNTFYRMEMPAELDIPPSQWPVLQSRSAATDTDQPTAAVEAASPVQLQPATTIQGASRRTAGRGFAVVMTAMAMSLMVFVFSRPLPQTDPGQASQEKPDSNLMNVSESPQGSGGDVISDDQTTLQEIDSVELSDDAEQSDRK